VLIIASGPNRVDELAASHLNTGIAGDADFVRATTGFAIGAYRRSGMTCRSRR
jgi:hypothetical protein